MPARKFFVTLKAALRRYFGTESPLLASFGIAADKPVTATAK